MAAGLDTGIRITSQLLPLSLDARTFSTFVPIRRIGDA